MMISVHHAGISYAQEQIETSGKIEVLIQASPQTGVGPLTVHFEPKIKNLEGRLKCQWHFGDGTESSQRIPSSHLYEAGKYAVILRVTDKTKNVFTASLTINADYPCG